VDVEELQGQLDLAREQLDQLNEVNVRIESAKHVGDLFPSAS
jgi:hypothetical protein